MKPSLEIEARGLRAYEQVGAFERLRTWRLPVSLALFIFIPVVSAVAAWEFGHPNFTKLSLSVALVSAICAFFYWRMLLARYQSNLELLVELEREYGDELSWVKVENHFAELEKLRRELAEEKNFGQD